MKLRFKIFFVFFILCVGPLLLFGYWMHYHFDKTMHMVEKNGLVNYENAVAEFLDISADRMQLLTRDYAQWDDMRNAVARRDSKWIDYELKLIPEIYNVDLMLVTDENGKILSSYGLHGSFVTQASVYKSTPFNEAMKGNKSAFLMRTDAGTMLVTASPLVGTHGSGKPRGVLVFGRIVDMDMLTGMATISGNNWRFYYSPDRMFFANIRQENYALPDTMQAHRSNLQQMFAQGLNTSTAFLQRSNSIFIPQLKAVRGKISDEFDYYLIPYGDYMGRTVIVFEAIVDRRSMLDMSRSFDDAIIVYIVISLILCLAVGTVFAEKIRQRLNGIIYTAEAIAAGEKKLHIEPKGNDEFAQLEIALKNILFDMGEDIENLCADNRELDLRRRTAEDKSMTDELTGLRNFRYLKEASQEFDCVSSNVSVIMIDMDNFKTYNDTYGHPAGNNLLECFSHILHSYSRDADLAVRFGGDEFVLMLPATNKHGALADAKKIKAKFDEMCRENSVEHPVTLSMGIATMPEDAPSVGELLVAADTALYDAKRAGRNTIVLYVPKQCVGTQVEG